MKTNWIKLAIAIVPFVFLASCNKDKEPDSTPAPVITKIVAADNIDEEITEAALNQSIAVFGENFIDIQEISVNNIGIGVREAYVTETRIDLVIPRQIPANPNNKLIIVAKAGKAEKTLNVVLPKLVINGFKNEFAADGEEVEITGENFDLFKIDKENATLTFNGAPIQMVNCNEKSFSIVIPDGTPWPGETTPWGEEDMSARNHAKDYGQPSILEISSPEIKNSIKVPFREQGISILTNDRDTWWNGWWPTGIIEAPFSGTILEGITPYYKWAGAIKMNMSEAWQYENVTYIHWWLPEVAADVADNPEKYLVKMEILNPSTTPLAKYMRIGSAIVEGTDNDHFLMWDPASANEGIALNTMGKWQTISFEVTDLYYPLQDGKKSSLVTTPVPATTFDDENTFKIAMQREEPGDVEFYYWNVRIVKKLEY